MAGGVDTAIIGADAAASGSDIGGLAPPDPDVSSPELPLDPESVAGADGFLRRSSKSHILGES